MQLTKEQFRAQFKYRLMPGGWALPKDQGGHMVFSEIYLGYKIYRLLEKLVLEDEKGEWYLSSI